MYSKPYVLTTIAVLAFAAVVGWIFYFYNIGAPEPAVELAQDPDRMQEEFEELTVASRDTKKENEGLRALNENLRKELNDSRNSLEQENSALRALNKNLKESIESENQKSREIIGRAAAELNTVNKRILEKFDQAEPSAQASAESASEMSNQESSADPAAATDSTEVNLLAEELQNAIANIDHLLTERQQLKQNLESAVQIELVEDITSLISGIFDDSLSIEELKEGIDARRKDSTDEYQTSEVIEPLMALIENLVERNEEFKKLALQLNQEVSSDQTASLGASERVFLNEELQNANVRINQLLTEQQELKRNLESAMLVDVEKQEDLVEEITSLIAKIFDDSLSNAEIKEQIDIRRKILEDRDLTPEAIEPFMALVEKLMEHNETSRKLALQLIQESADRAISSDQTAATAAAERILLNEELQIANARINQLLTEQQELKRHLESAMLVNVENQEGFADEINSLIVKVFDGSLSSSEIKEQIDGMKEELKNKEISSEEVDSLLKLMEEFVVANEKLTSAERRSDYLFARLKNASDHLRRLRKKIRSFEFVASHSEEEFVAAVQRSRDLERLLAKAEEEYELIRTSSVSESERLREAIEQLRQVSESKEFQIQTLQSELTAITLKTDILFDSASIELNPEGKAALLKISGIINNFSQGRVISIEGHTDNQPLKHNFAQLIPSNWELSTNRAASAARFLIANGVPAENVRIVGHGELKPIASNDTSEGRAVNRRIEIQLVPQLKPQLLDVEASN